MSTLGQKPATQHVSLQKQTITGNGGTSYTLQQSVGSALDIAVFINNTRQEPTSAYSASGTTLTMTGAVNASDHFYVLFLGNAITTTGLPVDAVATANINASAITEAKIANTAVTNAKIANSTIDLTSKVTGVLPTARGGTGDTAGSAMVKLLDATISSPVAQYDISSTHMNSTYDDYVLYATLFPSGDGIHLIMSVFENGSVLTGDKYSFETSANSSSNYLQSNSVHRFGLTNSAVGGNFGEGVTLKIDCHNVNSTAHSFSYGGAAQTFTSSANPQSMEIGGSLLPTERNVIVNGLRISFESGNIASGIVKLYGIK